MLHVSKKMINNRPEQLRGVCGANGFAADPFKIDWLPVPQSLNIELCSLVGFQPLTEEFAKAVGGQSFDVPSDDEVDYFESIDKS